MGEVMLVLRIMPNDPSKFGSVKKKIEGMKPAKIIEEDVAFGLKSLTVHIKIPDAGGAQDEMENKIRAIDGVDDVEVLMAGRCL